MRFLPATATAALTCLALAACVPPPKPTPAPTPAPAPAPAPAPPPVVEAPTPPVANWMDAPATPGDWTYAASIASFGDPGVQPRLTLACRRDIGVIEITRAGAGAVPQLNILTEFQQRALAGAQGTTGIAAQISATDPLLDAMAFSKGRFAVEVGGLPTLYIPSWSEVTRVIEDCR
jgi:hypothetical protein